MNVRCGAGALVAVAALLGLAAAPGSAHKLKLSKVEAAFKAKVFEVHNCFGKPGCSERNYSQVCDVQPTWYKHPEPYTPPWESALPTHSHKGACQFSYQHIADLTTQNCRGGEGRVRFKSRKSHKLKVKITKAASCYP